MKIVLILLAALGLAIAVTTIYFFILFFCNPVKWSLINHSTNYFYISKRKKVLDGIILIGSFLGIAICIFSGWARIFFWLPVWSNSDDPPAGFLFAAAAAFVGAGGIFSGMLRLNRALIGAKTEYQQLLEDELQKYKNLYNGP